MVRGIASPQEVGFSVISSISSCCLLSVTLWLQSATYFLYFIAGSFGDLPLLSWAAFLFQSVAVVLSSCRDSAASFHVFDVQHQSSNLLSCGFTFLHKHRAVKNNLCFKFSIRSSTLYIALFLSHNFIFSAEPGCILGVVPASYKQGQLHCPRTDSLTGTGL